MIILLSPSKTQSFSRGNLYSPTTPHYLDRATQIVDELKKLSPAEVSKMMKVSLKIAEETSGYYRKWGGDISSNSLCAFTGPAFKALDGKNLSKEALARGEKQLFILSGLYGILRAGDQISPHRFEMGLKWSVCGQSSPTSFWKPLIGEFLKNEIEAQGHSCIINLASLEYSNAVPFSDLSIPSISIVFKEYRLGSLRSVSAYAKRGRGAMARFVLEENIRSVESLKNYSEDGYRFSDELSTESDWVFVR